MFSMLQSLTNALNLSQSLNLGLQKLVDSQMSKLGEFLEKNSTLVSSVLPLTHTAHSYHIRSFLSENKILASPCDIYKGENLSYFFVGRPSYKVEIPKNAEFWELPCCFVVDFRSVTKPKRIFPFDSGGHHKGLMPSHISMMPAEEFEVSKVSRPVEKLIGTFFGTPSNYFNFKGRRTDTFLSEQQISPLDAEISSLHKLSLSGADQQFDDRNFAIELQSAEDVHLTAENVLAVVCPSPYLDDGHFVDHVESVWKAEILSYDLYPINAQAYVHAIYERVGTYLKANGYVG